MTVETIEPRAVKRGLFASAIAWVWPQPRTDEKRAGDVWGGALIAWLWPSRLGPEHLGDGGGRGLLAQLFGARGGANGAADAWWLNRRARANALMLVIAGLAIPGFMGGAGLLDGGRLNLFRGGGLPALEGSAPASDPATNPDVGGGDGPGGAGGVGGGVSGVEGKAGGSGGNGGSTGPTDGPAGDLAPPTTDDGADGGLVGGDGSGGPGPGEPGDGGPTILDPPSGGDDLSPEPGLIPGGGRGGGGGGGGGQPGDPTDPTDGDDPTDSDDPFTPPGTTPPGVNPPGTDPSGPLGPPDPPGGVNPPGGGGPTFPPSQFKPDPKDDDEDPGGPGGPGDTGSGDPTTSVPEPSTWVMLILGFGAAGYAIRRRRFAASVR